MSGLSWWRRLVRGDADAFRARVDAIEAGLAAEAMTLPEQPARAYACAACGSASRGSRRLSVPGAAVRACRGCGREFRVPWAPTPAAGATP